MHAVVVKAIDGTTRCPVQEEIYDAVDSSSTERSPFLGGKLLQLLGLILTVPATATLVTEINKAGHSRSVIAYVEVCVCVRARTSACVSWCVHMWIG